VPASDLFVLAVVVMCIAVVALAAVQSRRKTRVEPMETMPIVSPIDRDESGIGGIP
jgi:hypothetical protein